jgi:hypothetical protein
MLEVLVKLITKLEFSKDNLSSLLNSKVTGFRKGNIILGKQ